jgi:rhodanese-related sulfurtransferase
MSSINTISPEKLARLIGVAHCPTLIDVRVDDEWRADPRFIPGAVGARRIPSGNGAARSPSALWSSLIRRAALSGLASRHG